MGMVGHSWNIVPKNTFHLIKVGNGNVVFVFTQNAVSERFDKEFICRFIDFGKRDGLVIGKSFLGIWWNSLGITDKNCSFTFMIAFVFKSNTNMLYPFDLNRFGRRTSRVGLKTSGSANTEEAANATLNTATVFTSFIIHSKIKFYKINELSQEESESNLQIRPLGKVR